MPGRHARGFDVSRWPDLTSRDVCWAVAIRGQILTEKLGIPVNPQPTQGTVHNVKLVDSGGAQLGMTTTGVALQGWNGTGDWTSGKQFRTSLDDAATALSTGHIDAFMTMVGAPASAFQNVVAKEPVTFLSPSAEQSEVIRKAMPEFSPSKIAAGTYHQLDKDYVTIGMYNFAIGRADLPDDLVYQLVKAVFENQPSLVKATSTASETIPQNVVKDTFLPFHPGAVRYYREIGISIPELLVLTMR